LYVIEVKLVHDIVARVLANFPVADSETICSFVSLQILVSFRPVQGRTCRTGRESKELNTALYVRFEFIEFHTFVQ
jgi:hypothetical protein